MKCPRCGEEIKTSRGQALPGSFPFCSVRCKMVDLGHWFDESYKVSRPFGMDEFEFDETTGDIDFPQT